MYTVGFGLLVAILALVVTAGCGSPTTSASSGPTSSAPVTTSGTPASGTSNPPVSTTTAPSSATTSSTSNTAPPTSTTAAPTSKTAADTPVRLTWFGQSAFLLEASDGTRIIIDPYQPGTSGSGLGYSPIAEGADAVVVTHEHTDHNAVDEVSGNPQVFRQPTEATIGSTKITGVPSFHDDQGGASRGSNTIVVLDDGALRVVHLGDLGVALSAGQIRTIGRVDVLLVPVGGTYTIDAATALEQVFALAPRVVVPMHYKTTKVKLPLAPVDDFLARTEHAGLRIHRVGGSSMELSPDTLPDTTEVFVLEPAR